MKKNTSKLPNNAEIIEGAYNLEEELENENNASYNEKNQNDTKKISLEKKESFSTPKTNKIIYTTKNSNEKQTISLKNTRVLAPKESNIEMGLNQQVIANDMIEDLNSTESKNTNKELGKKVLEVNNIKKYFKTRKAVDNVSFSIKEGEIFGLIGPNGAGKTTIIKMITGLSHPTSGNVKICNKDVQKEFEKAIINVGGIIENPEFFQYMSGYDNLKYYASLYKGVKKERIDEVVSLVGMQNRIKNKVKTYSLGMKQRVGIAQSLLHSPKLLILDEPTNGLDPNGIKEIRTFLRRIAKQENISILVSSHILSEMELLCDTIGIIDNGHLVKIASMQNLKLGQQTREKCCIKLDFPNYAGKILIDTFHIPVLVAGKNIVFKTKDLSVEKAVSFLTKNGLSLFGVTKIKKSLEDIYMNLISKKSQKSIN